MVQYRRIEQNELPLSFVVALRYSNYDDKRSYVLLIRQIASVPRDYKRKAKNGLLSKKCWLLNNTNTRW